MKPISGFKPEAPSSSYPMLPKGLYVAQIKAVKLEGTEPDQRLVLRLDIIEGEHTGYYTQRYNAEKQRGGQFEVKYKGDFAIQIPNEGNTKRQHTDWDLRSFNTAIWAIEQSNEGYHWDWNEALLKGKLVGINVRQGTYNGNPYTTIGRLESVADLRAGRCKLMKDKDPRSDGSESASASAPVAAQPYVVDEDVPF